MGSIQIPLGNNNFTIIDADKYEIVSKYSWHMKSSKRHNIKYAGTNVKKNGKYTSIAMHTIINPPPQGFVIDHINGNGLDNRMSNIRIVTHTQNMWNRKDNNSGEPMSNIQKIAYGRFRVRFSINGKKICLGCYVELPQAQKVRDEFLKSYRKI